MNVQRRIAIAITCVTAASSCMADFIEYPSITEALRDGDLLVSDSMVAASIEPLSTSWRGMSSVRVVTFGIAFTTDAHARNEHLYEVASGSSYRGFTTHPGPINAVDIAMLENLHPRIKDMTIGFLGEGLPVSDKIAMQSAARALKGTTGTFGQAPAFNQSSGGGGGFGGGMSMSMDTSSTDLTNELPDSLNGVSGTSDRSNTPLGKHAGFEDEEGGFESSTGFYNASGGTAEGGGDDLKVVPLPVPAVLAGIGIAGAFMMRRSLRRRSH